MRRTRVFECLQVGQCIRAYSASASLSPLKRVRIDANALIFFKMIVHGGRRERNPVCMTRPPALP